MGYWGNPEATVRVLRPNPLLPPELGDVERVCYSGDLVKTDEEGFLYYIGRRDAMIKSSGFRISPTEVEEIAFRSGKVRHAAAIGVPDDLLGQAVKLFVVPRDDRSFDLDTSALLEFCSEHLPRHMVPKFIEVLTEIPVTSSGKVDYPGLRRQEGVA
jgi:acyl-CoA synthetase (AMP-forming)/AMP-acid ligase II